MEICFDLIQPIDGRSIGCTLQVTIDQVVINIQTFCGQVIHGQLLMENCSSIF